MSLVAEEQSEKEKEESANSLVVEALDVRDLGADEGQVARRRQRRAPLQQRLHQRADAVPRRVLRVFHAVLVLAFPLRRRRRLAGEPLLFLHGRASPLCDRRSKMMLWS
jgi:hypothetical protein